jgi:membrane-associated protease RseP (regulator of RpoE activity)
VRDASNGLPLAGAWVQANSGTDGNAFRVSVTTDARGEFTLPPAPVRATIVARRDGYAPAWRTAGEGAQWNVSLQPAPQHPGSAGSPPPQFEGVGMVLDATSGRVVVAQVNDGSPAERAGVQRGDVIVAVDGVATAGQPMDQVIGRIRGPAGTPVRLRFERGGQQFELTIRRRLLNL